MVAASLASPSSPLYSISMQALILWNNNLSPGQIHALETLLNCDVQKPLALLLGPNHVISLSLLITSLTIPVTCSSKPHGLHSLSQLPHTRLVCAVGADVLPTCSAGSRPPSTQPHSYSSRSILSVRVCGATPQTNWQKHLARCSCITINMPNPLPSHGFMRCFLHEQQQQQLPTRLAGHLKSAVWLWRQQATVATASRSLLHWLQSSSTRNSTQVHRPRSHRLCPSGLHVCMCNKLQQL